MTVDEKRIKDSWKQYMEELMNEENDWDHRISMTRTISPSTLTAQFMCVLFAREIEQVFPQSHLGRAHCSRTTVQQSPHCLQWGTRNSLQNCPVRFNLHHPFLLHSSLDRPHSPSQMASRSTQPFCHNTLSGHTQTDTHTGTQTDRQMG